MTFFSLNPKAIFGGRVLLLNNELKRQDEGEDHPSHHFDHSYTSPKKKEEREDHGTLAVVSSGVLLSYLIDSGYS